LEAAVILKNERKKDMPAGRRNEEKEKKRINELFSKNLLLLP
jgi:hypothetical protein